MAKIIFMGTPEFGANVLKTLIAMNHIPVLVICQPDKCFNRKKEIIFSPVKKLALEYKIPVLQPLKIADAYENIKNYQPDLMLTAAYGQFIPNKILNLFSLGAWNLHGSILPQLRGGAPIHWAVINQLKTSGVSLIRMVQKMDAGNIIAVSKVFIDKNETYFSLHNKLLICSQKILYENFDLLLSQNFIEKIQDENQVTFGYNIKLKQTFIDWNQSSLKIDALIRGLYNKPIAQTIFEQQIIKIYSAQILDETTNAENGFIVFINKNGIGVACGDHKIIMLQTIQLPSKKATPVACLINGKHCFQINKKFLNYE